MLKGKKIILGVTGGIAAYKSAHLVRLLIKAGCEVKVIMTPSATDFVTPKTLSVLSKNKVWIDFFDGEGKWNNHVEIAEWADLLLIAPLTANTLAKMVSGLCDNVLLTAYLSMRKRTVVAPAMDLEMYQHATVKKNLTELSSCGISVIPAAVGELASGLSGEGRMAEPEEIMKFLSAHFGSGLPLAGKSALVNAGPTYESIDPVRFIGNRSSGKMGIALAESLASAGASVTLVLGPSSLVPEDKSIKLINVESSSDMYRETIGSAAGKDIIICSAAVADYKPAETSSQKIKKKETSLNLALVRTQDVLAELGRIKSGYLLVGFALETENLLENAKDKLKKKNLDMIIANSATESGSGFGGNTNKVTIVDKHNKITNFELKSKQAVAADIVQHIISLIK